MSTIIAFLFSAVKSGTPLLFGTTGEILTEKAGNLNLGVEGMMYMGAFAGFYVGIKTNNVLLAILAGFLLGGLGALIYAFLTVTLQANQNVTGLTLTIFGTGFANFFGEMMIKNNPGGGSPRLSDGFTAALSEKPIPLLSEIPYIGKLFFSHNLLVYLAVLIALLVWAYIKFTKWGLNLRAVGENPAAADAAGINVTLVKYLHILAGGGICGLGGAYIAMVNGNGVWNNGCINGQGWISVALVIFASWSPAKAILGSLVFGAFTVFQLRAGDFADRFAFLGFLRNIPNAVYVMLPFLLTAVILIVSSIKKSKKNAQPASCGVNYYREER